jgi:hypothetical protein
MWTTKDGAVLLMPRSLLRTLAARVGAPEGVVMNELERGARRATRVGSFRARKMGRTYPVFRARSGPRSYDIVTRPVKGPRSWAGPHGHWRPTYGIVGVSSRFDDPYDGDPALPGDEDPTPDLAAPSSAPRLVWRGPLELGAAARLGGGGVYVVEDPRGQPVYVGQTASFARRMGYLTPRFPGHRVRLAFIAPPLLDPLGAVGDAVVRAVRGGAVRPGVLPAGHRYGAAPPERPGAIRIERTVRRLRAVAR